MELKVSFVVIAFVGFFGGGVCRRVIDKNSLLERDSGKMRSNEGGSISEFFDSSTGREKLFIDLWRVNDNALKESEHADEQEEENEMKVKMDSEVDEETIREAEKMADKDLLNGLNRILKKKETLKDVFKVENAYLISLAE